MTVSVSVNGKTTTNGPFTLTPADHIIVYGQGGSDVVKEMPATISGNQATVTVPAILLGGSGTNTLSAAGSSASNVLVGGPGKDGLTGGTGRDILIGGGRGHPACGLRWRHPHRQRHGIQRQSHGACALLAEWSSNDSYELWQPPVSRPPAGKMCDVAGRIDRHQRRGHPSAVRR